MFNILFISKLACPTTTSQGSSCVCRNLVGISINCDFLKPFFNLSIKTQTISFCFKSTYKVSNSFLSNWLLW